jgi:IstB-like ATP binding protein
MSDRVYQQLREHLAYLKLGAVAEQLAAALQAAETDKPSYTRFLADLLAVEVTATEQRRLDGRLRFASFPTHKTLEQFDFDAQPSLDRRLVSELATLRFVQEKSNVLLIGPPGVGKTMLATALGLKAVHAATASTPPPPPTSSPAPPAPRSKAAGRPRSGSGTRYLAQRRRGTVPTWVLPLGPDCRSGTQVKRGCWRQRRGTRCGTGSVTICVR